MRGETMKDKSKKSTYSTTFGVDPHKKVKGNDEDNEIRSADRVWEACGNDKQVVCADNKNVEIYKK